MQPHQERVVAERDDLADKVSKLGKFLEGKIFESLDEAERQRLSSQYVYMKAYLEVLDERIAAFGKV